MSEQRFVKYVNDTLKDTKTNKMYAYMGNMVNLLNEQQDKISRLEEENEQLKSYIDSMFLGNTHICKELDIEDAMFYCEKERKHIYPNCLYHKCFDEENLVEVKEEIRKCSDD